jgi:hypothetical protein
MESPPRLYDTLVHVLRQHRNWLDPGQSHQLTRVPLVYHRRF